MGGEEVWGNSLPLLPAGMQVFEALPARAIVLSALAPAIGEGIITVVDGNRTGVLVIRAGCIADALSFDGGRCAGDAALQSIAAWDAALMSASRLTDQAMSIIGPLISGERCYEDLRLEWTRWTELLDDLRARGGTYVVEMRTAAGRGVTVVRGGQQVATYTESHPSLGSPELIDALAAGGGSVRVTIGAEMSAGLTTVEAIRTEAPHVVPGESGEEAASSGAPGVPGETRAASASRAEETPPADETPWTSVIAQAEGARVRQDPTPAAETSDLVRRHSTPALGVESHQADGNATLNALFGDGLDPKHFTSLVVLDGLKPSAASSVGSLLPELKLLVQQRLHRSSGSVEDVVDAAADGGESVAWLADRVRVMTIRGFLTSTFEQLADDMLALARD